MTKTENQSEWLEVDNDGLFEYKEAGLHKSTLLFTRCTPLKKRVRRVRDAVEFVGDSRDECDRKLAVFCERPDVRLTFEIPEG